MPSSKKNTKWMVAVGGRVIKNVNSKTYLGACYKAFKKIGISPPKLTMERIHHLGAPITVHYDPHFEGVYCIEQ